MKMQANLIWIAAICLSYSAARAQPATAPATSPDEAEMIQLRFPENVEVKILIEYVSLRLGMNILYDEAVGRKRVTISAPTRIPKSSLIGLLEGVLKMAGLAIIDADQPGWKKIVDGRELLTITRGIELDRDKLPLTERAKVVTQVFEIAHVATAAVQKIIQPFLSKPGGNSFLIEDRNLLFVTDYAGNLRRVSELIELIDAPARETSIRFVPVKHRDAGDLVKQVTSLLKQEEALWPKTVRRRPEFVLTSEPRTNRVVIISAGPEQARPLELIETLDVPTSDETHTYHFRYVAPQRIEKIAKDLAGPERLAGRYRSTIDAESGMLIVTAPPAVHEEISRLQEELDVAEVGGRLSRVQFYRLMNTTAGAVLATIRAMESDEVGLAALGAGLESEPGERAPGKFTGPNAPPPAVGDELPKPPFYRPSEEPQTQPAARERIPTTAKTRDAVITVDTNTNTLIVIAPPSVQRIYRQLIAILDKRRPQVMIEATLVTLDTSEDFSLGIDMSYSNKLEEYPFLVFSSFGLSTVDPVTGSLALKPGVGFNGALVNPTTFAAVIKALAASGRARVISAPRVLVNDNATATLTSVSEAPFTSINASDTVSTVSFAGYASAGSTLTVTPHISEGDYVQLQYSITLNSFTGEGGGGVPPPRQTNNLTSEVTVPNGYAVIVGGLNRRDLSDTVTKVPWLGDIPILGHLFRLTGKTDKNSTLFVFIRPVILRDDQFEDLKYLSERDLELAELPSNLPPCELLIMQ